MDRRLELQSLLESLLGSRNVYYNPPATVKMQYDAIRYTDSVPDSRFADDKRYKIMNCYELVVISKKANHPVNQKLMDLPYCSPGRPYVADNLYHNPYTLYY